MRSEVGNSIGPELEAAHLMTVSCLQTPETLCIELDRPVSQSTIESPLRQRLDSLPFTVLPVDEAPSAVA